MVVGCMLMTGACVGVISNSMSVFVTPVCQAFGVSRATFSLYSTFSSAGSMLMAPIVGRWFEKHSIKRVMLLGAFMISSATFSYSLATEIWHFYMAAVVVGLCTGLCGTLAVSKLISNWFNAKKGLAIGIALSGSGLAASIVSPIITRVVMASGWQAGFKVMSATFVCLTIPTILFVLKETPAEMGLLPYGVKEDTPAGAVKTGFTRAQAVKSSAFWLVAASAFLTSFIGMGTQAHLIAYLSDIGYSPIAASGIFSGSMAVLIAGKIVLGSIYDKFGIKIGAMYGCGIFAVSLVLLIFAKMPFAPQIFIVTFGLANAIQTVQRTYIVNRLFGDLEYSSIFGLIMSLGMVGSAIAVPFSGLIFDIFGTYMPAWYGYTAVAVIIVVLIFAAENSAVKKRAELGIPLEV